MTIKKRIFLTNSCMVLLSLLILLVVAEGMFSLFKDELLGWYRDNSKIADNYEAVYDAVPSLIENTDGWESIAQKLQAYDYRLLVRNDRQRTVFTNVKHSEEESAETLYDVDKKTGQTDSYLIEHTTIISYRCTYNGQQYDCYVVNCPSDASIFGMDRGLFEMFIVIFLTVGGVVIVGILILSQLMTRGLIRKILEPVYALDCAAHRVTEGELQERIQYQNEDEFKNVCDSFDLMQEHLQLEMEKNRAYEKARTEMVSGISHDLRTPLTSIKGYVKGMLDGVANTEEKRREYLQITYRKSCDMEKLLSRLFYFSKLETGNMPFYLQPIDMESFLQDYVEEKEVELKEKDVAITLQWDLTEPVTCNLDREQMLRVLDNLVENSCKYAKTDHKLHLQLKAEMQADKVQITFSDNGPGMEEEKLTHVFEQFYRGDEARNAACDGNGLGLYVCRYIIEKQGGTIRAESHDGFHVKIQLPVGKK